LLFDLCAKVLFTAEYAESADETTTLSEPNRGRVVDTMWRYDSRDEFAINCRSL
jgi:hypothetical protein